MSGAVRSGNLVRAGWHFLIDAVQSKGIHDSILARTALKTTLVKDLSLCPTPGKVSGASLSGLVPVQFNALFPVICDPVLGRLAASKSSRASGKLVLKLSWLGFFF